LVESSRLRLLAKIKPGIFVLKSPFKENFIGSLHCYVYPNIDFHPQETIAYALVRHAEWYLKIRDLDALRERSSHEIKPLALCRGPMTWKEGILGPTGEFTGDPEAEGTPAILVWQDVVDDLPSFAIEIRGSEAWIHESRHSEEHFCRVWSIPSPLS
jgi:hypothetical protein